MATKKKNSVFDEDNDGSEIRVHQNPNKEVMEENNVSNTPLPTQETNVVPPTQNVVNNVAPTAEEINVVYNPLDGEVKKRDYASGNTNEPVVERVPEPPINNIPPPPPPRRSSVVPTLQHSITHLRLRTQHAGWRPQ